MKLNHKLQAVIRHEFLSIVRRPSFWISLLSVPLLIGLVLLLSYFTKPSESKDLDKDADMSTVVIDESGIIKSEVAAPYGIEFKDSSARATLLDNVVNGRLDGLLIYPATIEKDGKYLIFADNTDKDNSSLLNQLGKTLLQQSLLSPLKQEQAVLALSGGESTTQSYTNGEKTREFNEKIVPGAFLVVFYLILVFSVGYALTSISEEKENRSIEMVLSYIKPRALILGKLIGIILVTLLQLLTISIVALIAYFIAKSLGNNISLPFSVSDLTFVPSEIFIGISFLMVGFIFYVSLMAMVGSIFPSSKEASGFSTVFFLMPAISYYGTETITNQATSAFTQILTYFPLTSPTTVLLRNATGNLTYIEGLISLVILILSTVFTIYLAAKAFRLGTLEYTNRIKFTALLKK